MKNRLFFFCLLAAFAVSCVKDQQEVVQTIADDPVFYATIENSGDPDTRVFVDDQLRVLWNADDRVSIFNKTTYNRQYRFDGEDGANSGAFKKVPSDDFVTSNELEYVYSVYPYNENTSISNDGEITVYLPAQQTYRANSFGLGANTMIAITDEDELIFKNLCGYFAVKLYGENVAVSSITLKGNNNELLAGKATVVAQSGAAPTIQFDAENATKELTITFATPVTIGTTAETATTFWFVVPPTTFENGITLTVSGNDNCFFRKITSNTLEIKRNSLKKSGALQVIPLSNDPIQFADNKIKDKLVSAFDKNGDGEISYQEAALVTSLQDVFGDEKTATSFDEFQFFTGVTEVSEGLFRDWTLLHSILLPESILSINYDAFSKCSALEAIRLPSKVRTLDKRSFYDCTSLASITVPKGLKTIESSAFRYCNNLTELHISDIASWCECTIKSHPFSYHSGEHHLFLGEEEITDLVIPDGVTSVGQYCFSHCDQIQSVTIPESVSIINQYAFRSCSNVTSISIPKEVGIIGDYAFAGCLDLTSILIPEGLNTIGNGAFSNCNNLESVIIPESITTIGNAAFGLDKKLQYVLMKASVPPSFSAFVFEKVPIFVPVESLEAYLSSEYWSGRADCLIGGSPTPYPFPEPEAVDLGLSVLWATFNLGASKPEEIGNLYAWGETETKHEYTWENYKWCNGTYNTLTKYCFEYDNNPSISFGIIDDKHILDLADDAASCHRGPWRIPNHNDFYELKQNCTSTLEEVNGVKGFRFTSKVEGYTDKSIFIPNSGSSIVRLWTSQTSVPGYVDSPAAANANGFQQLDRSYGCAIRPVCPK